MGISGSDTAFTEFGKHSGVSDTQISADPSQGPTKVVKMDCVINLIRGKPAAAHRHVVTAQNIADRTPIDTEPGTQLIHRLSNLVSGDEFLDLIGAELAGPPGFGAIGGRWTGCCGVGKLPTQRFQDFYLRFRVIVSSPKVHHLVQKAVLTRGNAAKQARRQDLLAILFSLVTAIFVF
ncbi:hypothetical protein K7711_43310 [Nocardia sp. CA2R105]|uniref:hypothetical protein n=1 Tax=Nocardia coffeae TaxID=2873381 RepID=UPI001CA6766C|nr:hypothetical protein [Nocardia coffeae]MBY8863359.1 hypothetical protein [Nocardia coffeae]